MKTAQVSAGNLNRLISLWREDRLVGPGGRPSVTWEKLGDTWSAMTTNHAPPVARGDKLDYPVQVMFTVRFQDSFRDARQIRYGSRMFDVISANDPGEHRRFLQLRTREVV